MSTHSNLKTHTVYRFRSLILGPISLLDLIEEQAPKADLQCRTKLLEIDVEIECIFLRQLSLQMSMLHTRVQKVNTRVKCFFDNGMLNNTLTASYA